MRLLILCVVAVKTRVLGVDFLRERAHNGCEIFVAPYIADARRGNRNASGLAGVTNDGVGFLFRRHAGTMAG